MSINLLIFGIYIDLFCKRQIRMYKYGHPFKVTHELSAKTTKHCFIQGAIMSANLGD